MEHIGGELLSAAAAISGGLGIGGLVRAWIRHRTRLQVEREVSARAAVRAGELARLAKRHDMVLIDETDGDGHRMVRIRGRAGARVGKKAA